MHKPIPPKRSRRRLDAARMKSRARRIYPRDKAAKLANHLANCSCAACGNPRRHFNEKPLPERRFEAAARDAILEYQA
jgi:hypothetical protein